MHCLSGKPPLIYPVISEIDDDKAIEVALSFDKGYNLANVKDVFNDKLAWLWINTYSQLDINDFDGYSNKTGKDSTISGGDVFGFRYDREPDTQ